MITERWRWLLALPLVLVGWIAVLALVMRLSGAAPAALAILPAGGMEKLPAGSAVISAGPYSITVEGGAGLVAALYASGALLVLPAGLTGCLPQTSGDQISRASDTSMIGIPSRIGKANDAARDTSSARSAS